MTDMGKKGNRTSLDNSGIITMEGKWQDVKLRL